MTVTETPPVDPAKVETCAGQLVSIFAGSMLNYMIDIGHRTGLLSAAAAGPATSDELARRAGLVERYVREWLGAMTTGGLVDYDAASATYSMAPERAALLTDGPMSMAGLASFNTHLGKHVHQVARCFREGGGVPYAEYRPEFTDLMDGISRTIFDGFLVDGYLALVPGLTERLEAGAEIADVCCGAGHALVVLGRRFPASTFTGFDLDEQAVGRGRAEAAGAGLGNVRFEVLDAARLAEDRRFDAVVVFDALHDQVDPQGVLRRIAAALKPGGTLLLKEPHAADALEDNIGNPFSPILYGCSTLHCLTISLAHDGAGLGTVLGEKLARRLLEDAGFADVAVHPAPGDPADAVYVARTPEESR